MSDWQRTIKMGDVWDSDNIKLIAKTAADRLEVLAPFSNPAINAWKAVLVHDLRHLSVLENPSAKDFDNIWDSVYNWGDTTLSGDFPNQKKVCWINVWEKP